MKSIFYCSTIPSAAYLSMTLKNLGHSAFQLLKNTSESIKKEKSSNIDEESNDLPSNDISNNDTNNNFIIIVVVVVFIVILIISFTLII